MDARLTAMVSRIDDVPYGMQAMPVLAIMDEISKTNLKIPKIL